MTRRPITAKATLAALVHDVPKEGSWETAVAPRPRRKAAPEASAPAEILPPAKASTSGGLGLHTAEGERKYLTAREREVFLQEADRAERQVRTLCMTLAYAGCRLSEALALTLDRVDLTAGVVTFESLKKRKMGVFRSVPV